MTQIIAPGAAEASSSPFTLTDGSSATLNLFEGTNTTISLGSRASVELQTSTGAYLKIGELTSARPTLNVLGPGTFRVTKHVTNTSVGVDKT